MNHSPAQRPTIKGKLKHSPRAGIVAFGLILGIVASSTKVLGQPMLNEPAQWKQSIERPSRGWDYDGKRILGHIGRDICLWDAESGKLLKTMEGHKERIHVVQLSPDGKHALSSSWIKAGGMVPYQSQDTRTILWDIATGRTSQIFKGQVAGEFSPDGRRIVAFSQRPEESSSFDAAVWDAFSGRQLTKAKLYDHSGPYWDTLHFSPDARNFVHVCNGAFLPSNSSGGVLFNTSDGRKIGSVSRDAVNQGPHRYTSKGALASFDTKQKIRLIDIKSGRIIHQSGHDLKRYWGGAWTHDGSKVVAIPYDESALKIWDINTGKVTIGGKNGPYPQKVAIISPDNSRLAVEWGGANDVEPGLGIYDMRTGEEIARIRLAQWGHMLGFSPDSKTFLVGGSEFVVYSSENGRAIRRLQLLDERSFVHDWSN